MPVEVEGPRLAARDVDFLNHFVAVEDIPSAYLQPVQAWSSLTDFAQPLAAGREQSPSAASAVESLERTFQCDGLMSEIGNA